jgi:hypothetical protein
MKATTMKLLPDIPHDKAMHALTGLAIFILSAGLAHLALWSISIQALAASWLAGAIGIAASAAAGILKELEDALLNRAAIEDGLAQPHSVEGMDFVATLAGGAGGLVCWVMPVVFL